MNCVLSIPDCMLSKNVHSNVYGMQFFEWMEYTEDLTFGHCEGNNGRIYEGVVLGKYSQVSIKQASSLNYFEEIFHPARTY